MKKRRLKIGLIAAVVTAAYEGLQLGSVSAAAAAIAEPIARQHAVDFEVAGRSREAQASTRALLFALRRAVFLVYAVMAAQFESLVQPILIGERNLIDLFNDAKPVVKIITQRPSPFARIKRGIAGTPVGIDRRAVSRVIVEADG